MDSCKIKQCRRMKNIIFSPVFLYILCLSLPSMITVAGDTPDFLYLTLQWPGSKCNTKEGCCYNEKAKVARDFVITEMVPYYFNGTWPKYCTSRSRFNHSKIKDLVPRLRSCWPSLQCPASKSEKLWSNEWKKHGTCSETGFSKYFYTALNLQKKANLLKVLKAAGIRPNGSSYDWVTISDTIIAAGLHLPGLLCNKDKHGNFQLNKIVLCSNYQGTYFVECPGNALGGCNTTVKFPSF